MSILRVVPGWLGWLALAGVLFENLAAQDLAPVPETPQPGAEILKVPDEDVRKWLSQLGDADYAVREQATENLAKAGAAAVPGLLDVAQEPKLERAIRAVQALRILFEEGKGAEFEVAADALEELAAGRSGIAQRADLVLSSRPQERQQRAISRIEELGGEVRMSVTASTPTIVNGVVIQDDSPRVDQVLLGDDWKGGDSGVKLLRRLPPTFRIAVYVTPSCGITQQALDALEADRHDIEVQTRGSAMLGVSCDTLDGQLIVQRVQEGSGAAEAGLLPDDVVLKFEGKEIHDFQVIIDEIRSRKVGDKLTLEVSREGMTSTKVITLGKWTLKDLKR